MIRWNLQFRRRTSAERFTIKRLSLPCLRTPPNLFACRFEIHWVVRGMVSYLTTIIPTPGPGDTVGKDVWKRRFCLWATGKGCSACYDAILRAIREASGTPISEINVDLEP